MALNKFAKIAYTFFFFVIVVLIICGIAFAIKYKLEAPNLGILPQPEKGELFHLTANKAAYWGRKLEDELKPFKDMSYLEVCGSSPYKGCAVDFRVFNQCANNFENSYQQNQPCIFLTLENIRTWIPEYYNDEKNLPWEMTQSLKHYILNRKQQQEDLNVIWISCVGNNPVDVENAGRILLYPLHGFTNISYPVMAITENTSPLVAIYFEKPRIGIIITIECRAWAKNFPSGYIAKKFELLLD